MICRLCLRTLVPEGAICLFDYSKKEAKFVKLIAKYFLLEITQDDPISTQLCEDCSDHLEEFHKFWLYVDMKQSSLGSEFLAVKCSGIKEDTTTVIDVSRETVDNQEEILLDIKDIPAPEAYECSFDSTLPQENISVAPDIKLDNDSCDELQLDNDWADVNESIDDDIPLLSLKDKLQKKAPKVVKSAEKSYVRIKKIRKKRKKSHTSSEKCGPRTEKAKQNEDIIANSMLLSCDLCKESFPNYTELRFHFAQAHNRAAYVKCCGRTYRKPNLLAEHVEWHTNPSKFKCDICGKQLKSSKCLASHLKMIHSKKEEAIETISCPICSKGFRGQKCLDNHLKRHNDVKEYPCEICNKSFVNAQRLRKHIEAIHEDLKRHICDICGKAFKFKPSFERHVLEHQGIIEPPVQCNICGEWSKNKHVHRLHQFKHNNTNTDCKYCGRKCVSRTALRGHINYMHKKKYNLQCSFCDKTFKETRNLDEHMAIHTGAQLYSCPHCSKECRSRSN
ncbi:PREDICTED: transcription factor grauzone, partial [Rhagoletis zephyria]